MGMTKQEAEDRARFLQEREPATTGLTFKAKVILPVPSEWYVAGYYQGKEVQFVRYQ